jgi:hypothetical protein
MGAVPVTISGVIYPKGKSADDQPEAVTIIGYAWATGLGVGGGPIIPPGVHPEHPIVLPPTPPAEPTHPIVLPEPPTTVPPDVPSDPSIVKPPPPGGGWGWSPEYGWGYFPGSGGAGPKK